MSSTLMWTKSLQGLHPEPSTIVDYLSKVDVNRLNQRSWNFFIERYIFAVYVAKQDGIWHVKANSHRSQRTNESPHCMKMEFTSPSTLRTSFCDCAVG